MTGHVARLEDRRIGKLFHRPFRCLNRRLWFRCIEGVIEQVRLDDLLGHIFRQGKVCLNLLTLTGFVYDIRNRLDESVLFALI